MSYINKTASNNTSLTVNSLAADRIENIQNVYENAISVEANTSSAPFHPYTLDYSKGSVFYIPSNYTTSINFQCIIKNIPTDTSKVYTFTLMYYQPSEKVYCNQMRISDTGANYILGTSSTYGTPLFGNGSPTLLVSPCLIVQQISVISIPTSAGVFSRYVTTSISNNY